MSRKKTYTEATIVVAGEGGKPTGETVVYIGTMDRVAASQQLGYQPKDERDASAKGEKWMAYTAWHALRRAQPEVEPFDEWFKTFLGVEIETDEDDSGEAQTPA